MKSQKFDYEPFEMRVGGFSGKFGSADAKHALSMAKCMDCLVKVNFFGIVLNVTPYMTINQIIDNYYRKKDYITYLYCNSEQGIKEMRENRLAQFKQERERHMQQTQLQNGLTH